MCYNDLSQNKAVFPRQFWTFSSDQQQSRGTCCDTGFLYKDRVIDDLIFKCNNNLYHFSSYPHLTTPWMLISSFLPINQKPINQFEILYYIILEFLEKYWLLIVALKGKYFIPQSLLKRLYGILRLSMIPSMLYLQVSMWSSTWACLWIGCMYTQHCTRSHEDAI